MKKQFGRLTVVMIIGLALSLVTFSTGLAITITVDGVKEAAWNGVGGQTPGAAADDDEGGISNDRDISSFMWTNNTTTMFFLMETYANTTYTGNPAPTVVLCIDIDNNTGTGGSYANCNNMTGIDRSIVYTRFGIELYNGDPNTGTVIGTATVARQTATNVNEFSVDLASLGIGSGNCTQNMPAVLYFDNGTTEPDDNTPNSGAMTIGCGGPTVIELSNLNARANSAVPTILFAASVCLLIGAGSLYLIARRRKA
jgi:hypothetical protein